MATRSSQSTPPRALLPCYSCWRSWSGACRLRPRNIIGAFIVVTAAAALPRHRRQTPAASVALRLPRRACDRAVRRDGRGDANSSGRGRRRSPASCRGGGIEVTAAVVVATARRRVGPRRVFERGGRRDRLGGRRVRHGGARVRHKRAPDAAGVLSVLCFLLMGFASRRIRRPWLCRRASALPRQRRLVLSAAHRAGSALRFMCYATAHRWPDGALDRSDGHSMRSDRCDYEQQDHYLVQIEASIGNGPWKALTDWTTCPRASILWLRRRAAKPEKHDNRDAG